MNTIRIRCPKCDWEPDAGSRWRCSCGHTWNTFDTGGRCPKCSKVWEDTQCLSWECHKWSPHLHWYENLDRVVKEIEEVLTEPVPATGG
jgi:uncharacterized C2H2 Zn-finger protein